MSEFVVVRRGHLWPGTDQLRDEAEFYCGYEYQSLSDYGPRFSKTCHPKTRLSSHVADLVVKQLNELAYDVVKVPYVERSRTRAKAS